MGIPRLTANEARRVGKFVAKKAKEAGLSYTDLARLLTTKHESDPNSVEVQKCDIQAMLHNGTGFLFLPFLLDVEELLQVSMLEVMNAGRGSGSGKDERDGSGTPEASPAKPDSQRASAASDPGLPSSTLDTPARSRKRSPHPEPVRSRLHRKASREVPVVDDGADAVHGVRGAAVPTGKSRTRRRSQPDAGEESLSGPKAPTAFQCQATKNLRGRSRTKLGKKRRNG